MIERMLLEGEPNGSGDALIEPLRREFPRIPVGWSSTPRAWATCVDVADWRGPEFPASFDALLAGAGGAGETLLVHGGTFLDRVATAGEVLTRYQHRSPRRNEHSEGAWFEKVLRTHRALHDLRRPLVAADYLHALDVWQWCLRLEEGCGLPVQLAALFHDVERLSSEPERWMEHEGGFKLAHAEAGARLAGACLRRMGLGGEELDRVAELIGHHREPSGDHDVDLLNDADALSFLSLGSAGFLARHGPARTRHKLYTTLARLSAAAERRLVQIRFQQRVAELLGEVTGAGWRAVPPPSPGGALRAPAPRAQLPAQPDC